MAWVLRPDTEEAASAAVDTARQAHLERGIGSEGGWRLRPEAPAPSAEKGLYQRLAEPVTKAVSRVADGLTEPLVAASRVVQGEPVSQVIRSYSPKGSPSRYDTPALRAADVEARSQRTNPLAEILVPQTPIEFGANAATLAVPWAAPLVKGAPALARALTAGKGVPARVAAGAVGGEVGGQVSDETTGKGAAIGGLGGLLGEIVGGGAPKIARSLPGMKTSINKADTARIGGTIGEVSPALRGHATVDDLNLRLAGEPGQQALSTAREAAVQKIESVIGGNALTIPSLGAQPVPLRDAQAALSKIGDIAFDENPLTQALGAFWSPRDLYGQRVETMADARKLYGQVRGEIEQALAGYGPRVSEMFNTMQHEYASGEAIRSFFQKGNLYQGMSDRTHLNMPMLQRSLKDPNVRATLEWKLGPDFQKFADAIMRGGQIGRVDEMAPGTGTMFDALFSLLRRQNTGSQMIVPIAAGAAGLPNIGSSYTGNAALTIPPKLRAILDAAGQRGVNALERE